MTISKFNPWLIWFPAGIFYFYQYLLRVSPSVMKDDLMHDFGMNGAAFGLLASFYYYGYSLLQIPLGSMADYFGPRKLLAAATLVCVIGTAMFAQATDLHVAQLGRFLIGLGSSCAFLGCLKFGTLWFPMSKLPLITSATIFIGTLGANFGGAPLKFLINYYDWRTALLIVAGLGILVAVAIWFISKDKEPDHTEEQGTLFEGLKWAITSPQILLGGLYGFFIYTPLSVFADLWGAGFLEKVYSIPTAQAAGYVNLIYIGFGLGCMVYALALVKWMSIPTALKITAITIEIPFSILLLVPGLPLYVMGLILFTLGVMISGRSLMFAFVCSHIPAKFSGATVGLINTFIMLSGVVFQPVAGRILDYVSGGKIVGGVHVFEAGDYRKALIIVPICLAAAFLVSLFFKESKIQHNA